MKDEEIQQTCHRHGLMVESIRRDGDVLVLVPKSLDMLPPASRLQTLAEELRGTDGVEHVTLAVEDDE